MHASSADPRSAGAHAASATAGALAAAASASAQAASSLAAWPGKKIIAIQLDSIAPANEGVERVLDEVQQRASVNVLMIDSLWFTPGVSAAELAREDLRGHVKEPNSGLVGGRMGFVNPEYYHDTGLDLTPLTRASGAPDILAALCTGAKKRGLRVIPIIKDILP